MRISARLVREKLVSKPRFYSCSLCRSEQGAAGTGWQQHTFVKETAAHPCAEQDLTGQSQSGKASAWTTEKRCF